MTLEDLLIKLNEEQEGVDLETGSLPLVVATRQEEENDSM